MIDETDINMIDSTGAFKFEKLSANDDAVAEFIKDLKMLDSLRQKVEPIYYNSSHVGKSS